MSNEFASGPGKTDGVGQVIRKGVLVEDETVVGGTDVETGETVIKPKTTEGSADESVVPTDVREKRDGGLGPDDV